MSENVQIRNLSVSASIQSASFRVKAFKQPVNKDTSKVQHSRGQNNIPTHKPFTLDPKTESVIVKYSLYPHSLVQVFCYGTPCCHSTDQ